MSDLTLAEMLAITNGKASGIEDLTIKPNRVSYDSREDQTGGLFAAFVGTQSDGHDFAAAAVASGAIAALVSRAVGVPSIVVPNVQQALQDLAIANRNKLHIPVLALTGSSGKTTTKDLLIDLLEPLGNVVATVGSRNNEIGLPVTLLSADQLTKAMVLEMGARHRGNIKELCQIARPTIVGITNIGSAHLGEFGSREAIMHTKGEIVELLTENDIAVLNADQLESKTIAGKTRAQVWYAGLNDDADLKIKNLKLDSFARASFKLRTPAGEIDVNLKLLGMHQAHNAAIAAGMALAAGVSLIDIADALNQATAKSKMRMAIETVAGLTLIDDSYNANPESVKAALASVAQMDCAGRKIAVLGEMAELGGESAKLHQEVGDAAADLDLLLTVGETAEEIYRGALSAGMGNQRAHHFKSKADAVAYLRHELKSADLLLIKASRAAGFDQVAQQVRQLAAEWGN